MRSIQDVGVEILGNNPSKFYIFTGSEYGIKNKYLETLKTFYGDMKEVETVQTVIDMMSVKHMIPLPPALYVVRYDDAFLSTLTQDVASKLAKLNIIGTLVCIYDDVTKKVDKLDKYLPEYTVNITAVDKQFLVKYLHTDFPGLPDRLITISANIADNYCDAQNICRSMMLSDLNKLSAMLDADIVSLFGKSHSYNELDIKIGIAARNFNRVIKVLANYPGESDTVLYTILGTMVELEKLKTNLYAESPLREYTKRWTHKDIYNMFMHTYDALKKLRSYATDTESIIVYLASLLKFSEIPDVEVME